MAIIIEAPEPEPSASAKTYEPEQPKGRGRRKALSSARRELSDNELASSAVQKLLLDEIERLEEENIELCGYRNRYHEVDKKAAVLEQKIKQSMAHEIISVTCLTVGAAAIGYAPKVWSSEPTGYICLAFGILLIIGGIVSKAIKSWT